jgi:Protein of unknown function (DUF4065)
MYQDKTTTQMAARFLRHSGNRLPYIVLLKMLYLADRQMLVQFGEPISYDRWVSMENGPLLSHVYDVIKHPELSEFWSTHIKRSGYDVELVTDPGDGSLSELKEEVIDAVFSEYHDPTGKYEKDYIWALVSRTHDLPEWGKLRGLYGGASEITYEQVLRSEGIEPSVIEDTLENIKSVSSSSTLFEEVF